MNELIFLIHILTIFGFALVALKLGKEALTAWIALQAVLANLFVLKQITFWGLNITCSDAFAIGSILGLNLLRYYYTPQAAQKALWICLFSMIFFVVMAQFQLVYQPSPFDSTHSAYLTTLSHSPRILTASLAVFLIIQRLDLYLFSVLHKLPLFLRNALAVTCSQLLDTVLFTLLGLWGLVDSLTEIIAVSFAVKLIIIICSSSCMKFLPTRKELS